MQGLVGKGITFGGVGKLGRHACHAKSARRPVDSSKKNPGWSSSGRGVPAIDKRPLTPTLSLDALDLLDFDVPRSCKGVKKLCLEHTQGVRPWPI